jgi:hypothetical protein
MMYKTLILVVLLGLNLSVMARTKKDLRSKSVYEILKFLAIAMRL